MTSRESEILNSIYLLGGRCSMRTISKETGLSSDYTSLVSGELLNKKLIRRTANNVFILTNSGRSLLEHARDGSERNIPILIEVSRSFVSEVEPPSFGPEIHFVNKEFMSEQPCLTEHNLGKRQITEMADAQSIQKSLKRLTFVNRKRSKITD